MRDYRKGVNPDRKPTSEGLQESKPVNPKKDVSVNPKSVNPVNPPLDPWDWSDRRNFSEAYLKCLDEQGGKLIEASIVALKVTRLPMVDRPARSADPDKKAKAKAILSALS